MSTIKPNLFAMFVLLVGVVAAPLASTQPARADDPMPQEHFRLTGVKVDPVKRTKTTDGKTNDSKSDTLTHSLPLDTLAVAELIDGTKDSPCQVRNPTVQMIVTVDTAIKFTGKHVSVVINRKGDLAKPAKQNQAGQKQASKVSFLVCGQKTYIIGADGKPSWTYPHKTRDGFVLDGGDIILTLNKSKKHKGGAVVRVSPNGKETLIWEGTQAEVNSAQPTAGGTFVITEAGPNPRLLEVTEEGEVKLEFPLLCQKKNVHLQTRMARKLPDGTFLVPHLLDFAVFNYDATGKVISKLDTTVPGDTDHQIHTWPFTAIRHGDGQTLVTCTNGNRVVDFDADGKVTWALTNEDLPGPWLKDPCGAQVLPNGNVVIASYAAGKADPNAPKLFEVSRDKKVVWKYSDGKKAGVHHFQIIDINGKTIPGPPMK